MILNVPGRRVHGLPDSREIRLSVRGSRDGCRTLRVDDMSGREHDERQQHRENAGGRAAGFFHRRSPCDNPRMVRLKPDTTYAGLVVRLKPDTTYAGLVVRLKPDTT